MTTLPLTGATGAALDRLEQLCDLERWAEALELSRPLVDAAPEDDTLWCVLARCYLGLAQPGPALEAARRAVALTPDHEWPHRLVSYAATVLGRHDLAVQAARESVRLEPELWQTHARLAGAAGQHPDGSQEAAAASRRALTLAPYEPEVQLVHGAVAAKQGRRQEAERAYRAALELDPQNATAHHLLATLKLRRRTGPSGLARAATGFATALGTDPTAQISRTGLELTLRLFLTRAAYFLFATGYLGLLFAGRPEPAARLVPVLLMALPLLFIAGFVRALGPPLRRYLGRLLRRGGIAVAVLLGASSVALVLAAAVAPQPIRLALAILAAVTAFAARLGLYLRIRRLGRVSG